jgi:hypothetical protein
MLGVGADEEQMRTVLRQAVDGDVDPATARDKRLALHFAHRERIVNHRDAGPPRVRWLAFRPQRPSLSAGASCGGVPRSSRRAIDSSMYGASGIKTRLPSSSRAPAATPRSLPNTDSGGGNVRLCPRRTESTPKP